MTAPTDTQHDPSTDRERHPTLPAPPGDSYRPCGFVLGCDAAVPHGASRCERHGGERGQR